MNIPVTINSHVGQFFTCFAVHLCAAMLFLVQHSHAAERSPLRIEEQRWVRVEGAHFTLYSSATEWTTRRFFERLQVYTIYVRKFGAFRKSGNDLPVDIFLFNHPLDRRPFTGNSLHSYPAQISTRGFTALIAATDTDDPQALEVPYAHFLFRGGDPRQYPIWFEMGLTRYLGTLQSHGQFIELNDRRVRGLLGAHRSAMKRVLEFDESLIGVKRLPAHFREMSWALFHLLRHRSEEANNEWFEDERRYLEDWRAGRRDVQSFESAFGLEVRKLAVIGNSYRFKPPQGVLALRFDTKDPALRDAQPDVLSRGEIAAALANLAAERGNPEAALQWYRIATAETPDVLDDAARCMYARLENGGASPAQILGAFARLELDQAARSVCALEAAHALLTTDEPTHEMRSITSKRIEDLASGIEAGHRFQSEALYLRAQSLVLSGGDPALVIKLLEDARRMAPLDATISGALMQTYLQVGARENALKIARRLFLWADQRHPAARAAKELLSSSATPVAKSQ